MELSSAEALDLAGAPRNPASELVLIWRILKQERLLAVAAVPVASPRPALTRAA